MLPLKSIIGFLCRFLLLYGLLIAPWPGVEATYATWYRAGGMWVSGVLGARVIVLLRPGLHPEDAVWDTTITVINRAHVGPDGRVRRGGMRVTPIFSRYFDYRFTVFVMALILATPTSWSRRGWALLEGMVWLHLFLAGKLVIMMLCVCNTPRWSSPLVFPPFWKQVLSLSCQGVIQEFYFGFIVAVLIWLFVSFLPKEWSMLLEKKNTAKQI